MAGINLFSISIQYRPVSVSSQPHYPQKWKQIIIIEIVKKHDADNYSATS